MNDALGDRMKSYEAVTKSTLTPRMPVIIRIDGKAFHSFTKGFEYPFDQNLSNMFQQTGLMLFEEIQNSILIYGQSDEISILLKDYKELTSQQWFGGKIQKMASVSSSIATAYFNKAFTEYIYSIEMMYLQGDQDDQAFCTRMLEKSLPLFDARVFNIPESDVANYFYWRYKDCLRNSVSMAARAQFSHKELNGKSVEEMKRMLRYEADKPWEDMSEVFKNGWVIGQTNKGPVSAPCKLDIREIVNNSLNQEKFLKLI